MVLRKSGFVSGTVFVDSSDVNTCSRLQPSLLPSIELVEAIEEEALQVLDGLVDEEGYLYLNTTIGLGLVHTLDVPVAAELIEQGQDNARLRCKPLRWFLHLEGL